MILCYLIFVSLWFFNCGAKPEKNKYPNETCKKYNAHIMPLNCYKPKNVASSNKLGVEVE